MREHSVLSVRNLSAHYGRFQALREVSFEIPPGATGLLGPNGAGKTTLLKILLGLMRPSSGTFFLPGDEAAQKACVFDRIGYMPEGGGVRPGLSAVAWVAFLGELSGLPRNRAIERAHAALSFAGLEESRYREGATFSTGMLQRLNFAAALVHDPDFLFLDEPTSGLDPSGREEMLELIRELKRIGKTVLLSTHLLKDVEEVCEQAILLHRGRVLKTIGLHEPVAEDRRCFLVEWEGDAGSFLGACRGCGWETEPDGKEIYRLLLPAEAGAQDIFALLLPLEGTIRRCIRKGSSLQEVYLSAMSQVEKNAGL